MKMGNIILYITQEIYGDIEKKEDTRSARIDELIVDDGKLSVKKIIAHTKMNN